MLRSDVCRGIKIWKFVRFSINRISTDMDFCYLMFACFGGGEFGSALFSWKDQQKQPREVTTLERKLMNRPRLPSWTEI